MRSCYQHGKIGANIYHHSFIRGVAYQQDYQASQSDTTATTADSYTDPLANITTCMRDIPYLVQLRTNVIRTYAVNPANNHSACMNALAAAGIYVISDLSDPTDSINRDSPAWTTALYTRYTSLVDNMAQYQNTIGFFAGNEVSNSDNTTAASAYVKAAVRDTKAYIVSKGYRSMGVGYATYDGPIRDQLAQYFNCGPTAESIDFWGYNVYSWCGDSSFSASGYDERTAFFQNYSVPAFFAEYGCNTVEPRTWTETAALFGSQMTSVWSGGIVYEYFQSTNNYGLVNIGSNNEVSTLTDYSYLSVAMATVSPSSTSMSAVPTTFTATTCPSVGPSWSATASPLPPAPNANLCNCANAAAGCVINPTVSATAYGNIFNYICGNDPNACAGILGNATTGTYGAFEPCPAEQQLNYVMNQYYSGQSSSSTACAFSGQAMVTSVPSPSGTCATLLKAVGASGTGTVAAAGGSATGVGASSGGSSGGATSSASGSKGAAAGVSAPSLDFGIWHVGLYAAGALLTGAGMILL